MTTTTTTTTSRKYTEIASHECEGAYGFESSVTLERRADGLARLTITVFAWTGNSGGSHTNRLYSRDAARITKAGRLLKIINGDEDAIATMSDPSYASMVGHDDVIAMFAPIDCE